MLRGVSVLELGGTRASAFAGRLLLLAGADVTQVRPPGVPALPEAARAHLDPGKRSLPVEDPAELAVLVAAADVVVTDLGDAALAQWDVVPARLRATRPELVVVHLRPTRAHTWPPDGSCGELSMQAASGFMHMTGRRDREPLGIPYHLGCHQLGIHAAGSASASLVRRLRTGEGALVELVGADILASYLRIYGAVSEYYDIPLVREGRRAPGSGGRYPFGIFPCRDGYVALIARSSGDWQNILAMMGHPSWSTQSRFQDMHAIAMDYPDEMDRLVEPWFRSRTREELLSLGRDFGIPMAPVRRIDELPADPQFVARKFFRSVSRDGVRLVVPGLPWRHEGHDPGTNGVTAAVDARPDSVAAVGAGDQA